MIRTLRRGSRGPIVLQHNFDASPFDTEPLRSLPNVHLLRASRRQVRADFSCQVQPYLDVIDWLEREQIGYDWLINTTAQDYPVTPVPRIEAFLEESSRDGYLRHWDVFSDSSPWSRRKPRARYYHRYVRLRSGSERWLRAVRIVTRFTPLHFYLDYGPLVGVRCLRTPFGPDFRCFGGWAWWTLRREAALYLREFLSRRPDVELHYRRCVTPEESIVQTVLVNSGRFDLVDDDFRFIDYSGAIKGSPRTLTVADLPLLSTGRYHLARKFDLGTDREVLDRIDRELLGVEG